MATAMDKTNRLLWLSTGLSLMWIITTPITYFISLYYIHTVPQFVYLIFVASVGSAILLMNHSKVLLLRTETANKEGINNFTILILSVYIYFFLIICMWSFMFVFIQISNSDPSNAPFCSGPMPINSDTFMLMDAIYFTVTSFTTVGYGDIYACSSLSRRAVISELSTTVTIGLIALPTLMNFITQLAEASFAKAKLSAEGAGTREFVGQVTPIVKGMFIIACIEPFTYGLLVSGYAYDSDIVKFYDFISASILIPMAIGALKLAINRLLGNYEAQEITLTNAIKLIVLAYGNLAVGFAYIFLYIESNNTASFAFTFAKQHHLSFVDALYFSITTLTTVGFGDITGIYPVDIPRR